MSGRLHTLTFRLVDYTLERTKSLGEVDLEIKASDGSVDGLWIDGHDYSSNGEVIEAVLKLVGQTHLQSMLSHLASREDT